MTHWLEPGSVTACCTAFKYSGREVKTRFTCRCTYVWRLWPSLTIRARHYWIWSVFCGTSHTAIYACKTSKTSQCPRDAQRDENERAIKDGEVLLSGQETRD